MIKSVKFRFLTAILAIAMMCCPGCKGDDDETGGNGGNIAAVAITLDLLKGKNDNEIIVKCTPAAPWVKMGADMGFPACYFNRPGLFYVATKTGGTASQMFSDPHGEGVGWNNAGTEYTYVFDCIGENWEGTVTLAPVDQQHLKDIKIELMGVKSITIGKNDPVPLKLGYDDDEDDDNDDEGQIPGLGNTPGDLSGKPFTLPDGIELTGEITGGGNPFGYWGDYNFLDIWEIILGSASTPHTLSFTGTKSQMKTRSVAPLTRANIETIHYYGSGFNLVPLVIPLRNVRSAPVTVTIPAATIFESKSGTYQNGVLIKKVTFTVPANSDYSVCLLLYCGNLSKSGADEDAAYTLGVVSDAKPLLDLCERVKNKKINIEEFTPGSEADIRTYYIQVQGRIAEEEVFNSLQMVVWCVTDFFGRLTDENINFINSLPDSQ